MARETQIYFIQAAPDGLIKIGKSRCAVYRLTNLRTMSPVPLELRGIMLCPDGGRLERQLHDRFAEIRSHGEWFRPEPVLLDFIRENARPPRPRRKLSLVERAEKNRIRRERREFAAARSRDVSLDAELAEWSARRGYDDVGETQERPQ